MGVREKTYIGESTKLFCGPRCFLLVHRLNFRSLLVRSSSSNMFLKIAKILGISFKDRKEKVKFVSVPQICFAYLYKSSGVLQKLF
jgi:hypothetical protein